MRFLPAIFALAGCAALVACAQGTGVDSTFTPGSGGSGGFGGAGGSGGRGGSTSAPASSSESSAATSGAGGDGSGGGSTTSSSTSSTGSGGPMCDFTAPDLCTNATQIGNIDGDQNNDTRTVKGNTAKWFKIEVIEAVSSIFSFPQLSYTATLASPPGMDYDLYEYDGDSSKPDCFGVAHHGLGDTYTDTWGDSKGSDDSRWIILEVRYISGDMCGPADQWTLTVQGHTNP